MADLPILDELRQELREAGRRTAPARPRLPLLRPAFALAATVLAVAFVVTVGGQGGGAGHSSAQGPMLTHLRYDEQRLVDGVARTTRKAEAWVTEDQCRARTILSTAADEPFNEYVVTPEEIRSWMARSKTIQIAPGPALLIGAPEPTEAARRYLRAHRSTIIGRIERFGRPMVWRQIRQGAQTMQYLTAADSLEVFEIRMRRNGREIHRLVVRSREQVPFDEVLLQMTPRPGAKVRRLSRGEPLLPGHPARADDRCAR